MNQKILGDKKRTSFDDTLADYVNELFEKMPDFVVPENFPFTVQDLVKRGCDTKFCFDIAGEKHQNIGYLSSLKTALRWANETNGVVATLPYLIAGLSVADGNDYLRKLWHTAYTEENIGIDIKENFFQKGEPIMVVVHGGGLLTPERIERAYRECLSEKGAITLDREEFNNLLEGILPSGKNIRLYTIDDVKQGKIKNPFGRYGVVIRYQKYEQYHNYEKNDFVNNDLVLARAGTLEYLEKYFDAVKIKDTNEREFVRSNQSHEEKDFSIPKALGVHIMSNFESISSINFLGETGRFVVVPQEDKSRVKVIMEG